MFSFDTKSQVVVLWIIESESYWQKKMYRKWMVWYQIPGSRIMGYWRWKSLKHFCWIHSEFSNSTGVGFKTVLGSTHIIEQLLFYKFSSILTFVFDLVLESFSTFWVLMGYFGVRVGFKNCFGVSSYRLITFIFRMMIYFCSIM